MIPRTAPALQPISWQDELRNLITDGRELLDLLELDFTSLSSLQQASLAFPLKVARPFAARIRKQDPLDPLLLQILPQGIELAPMPGFTANPVGDHEANVIPGLLHKYQSRVLLITSGGCAINCRYCFRREFPYEANNPGRSQWEQALTYIANNSSIDEVILSGGDPLVINNKQLAWLIEKIEDIAHIKTLRIHTRLPVVIPTRIDCELLSILTNARLPVVMVVHINHPQEIDNAVRFAFAELRKVPRLTLLNQSVLLKGVNDDVDTLICLSHQLHQGGVLPYYLHLLDKVSGAAHFDVPEDKAKQLMARLLESLPGYLVPRLVKEEAGQLSKTPILY